MLTLTFLASASSHRRPTGRWISTTNYGVVPAGYWWEVLFDALAIATLVVSVSLISDAIQAAFER